MIKLFGRKSTELTGYPTISIFHDFKYHPKEVITGGTTGSTSTWARSSGPSRSGPRTRRPESRTTT